MNDGQLRALLDQVLAAGPIGPRREALDRLVVELQARGWRLTHSERATAAREASAREGGDAIEQ